MKNNFVFNNVTSNYPHQFTAGNTKMEYMALGFKELGASVTAINSISSCTKDNCDEISISEKGIEYTTFSSHKTFWRYYTTMDISHTKNIREYIKLMQLEQS